MIAPSFRPRSGRLATWVGLLLLLVALLGYGAWRLARPTGPAKPPPDMIAVLRLNNQGLGHMERFEPQEYAAAEAAFREVVDLAPDWLPGRINLGIALLNQHLQAAKLDEAVELFQQVLAKEPRNPYAHHCLGIIFEHRGQFNEAIPHFKQVTEIDPDDPFAWYHLGFNYQQLGMAKEADSPEEAQQGKREAQQCFERVRQLDPAFGPASYQLGMILRETDMAKAKALLDEGEALKKALWDDGPRKLRYSEMGRYAEVINPVANEAPAPRTAPLPLFKRDDQFQVRLRPGARWATAADFGKGPSAELRTRLRARFGATLVVLDYDRDGKPDLFLLGAVVEAGQVRDLLLHNEGHGHFTDVTVEAGLGGSRPSLGCTVGDFDNDGYPDLFITGIGEQHLFRNTRKGGFEDVTRQAGLDTLKTVCLGATFVDLDQDGDLDLLVAQYAATPESALAVLGGSKPGLPGPGLAVYLNVGEARAQNPREDPPPLTPRFRRAEQPAALLNHVAAVTGIAVADLDCDRDLDLLVLADQAPPAVVLNDRLLRFHRASLAAALVPAAQWNGALVFHAKNDERPDLFLLPAGQPPLLLLNRCPQTEADVGKHFEKGSTNSPPLLHAQAIDLDLDGRTDIVGLSDQRKPVLLHNDGRGLVHAREALGADADWPHDLVAVAAADFNDDGFPDLLVWSESSGLQLRINQKNGNHGLLLDLTGHRRIDIHGEPTRTNADGVGTRVVVQVEDHRAIAENTTQSAGLGQSRGPLALGLGRFPHPDVVRFRWPDNVWQAEFNLPIDKLARVDETERKDTSCPVLFTWNGQRFVFVTDFLGAGSMGELGPDGRTRPPRPEESVKIEPEQLALRDGHYVLKVAEPMDEVVYLDRLQLVVVDHPADVRVYPDERFVSAGPPPTQDLLAFRRQILPVRARDHRGRDVTAVLRYWDRDTVDGFARRSWLGYAEEHWVELDFGDRLARFGPQDRLVLCMAGWTDYPYPESIWAATQAGIGLQPPVLERLGSDGQWRPLVADAGFPAGLPRLMTLDVTGKLAGPRCVVRLRTNMQVYWDQIFVAPLEARIPAASIGKERRQGGLVRATNLEVGEAILETRGCPQEYSPDGRLPTLYDHDRLASVPMARLAGCLTRTGTVTELLRDRDDRFVIFGPGDEITVRFDARPLPALPAGWKRSFVLRTWGYSKDCGPFTATGDTIEPLPFQGMTAYPYGPGEQYPRDRVHAEYQRRYNTRQVGTGRNSP